MRAFAGQAARAAARSLRIAVNLALATLLIAGSGVGLLAWRLSSGPLELKWLAPQLAAAANADPAWRIGIRSAALAWEGFHSGVDQPLDIQISGITVATANGSAVATIPRAEVFLSPKALLAGHFVARTLRIDGARLRFERQADGSLLLNTEAAPEPVALTPGGPPRPGMLAAALRELAKPPAGDLSGGMQSIWSQVRHAGLRDAAVEINDHQLGVVWRAGDIALDITRADAGGLQGDLATKLELGDQSATLTLHAAMPPSTVPGGGAIVSAAVSAINPAKLAAFLPAAAALAGLDVPVALTGSVTFDDAQAPGLMAVRAEAGAGTLAAGTGHMPVERAVLLASGTADQMKAEIQQLVLLPHPQGQRTIVQGHAELTREASGGYSAMLAADLDRVTFADLPDLWPEGVGGPGTRPWITANIPAGNLHDGHFEAGLKLPADFSDVALTRIVGGITGDDVSVSWLRPVPPIEKASAKLSFLSPDAIAIDVTGGRQAGGSQGGIQIQTGRVVLSGLSGADQFADIDAQVTAPVADVLTLLRHPRIKLLDRSPLKLQDAGGQLAGKLTLTHLPLRDAVTMDDVQIRTLAKLTNLRVAGLAAGRDVDHGTLTLDVNSAGLRAAGSMEVSGVPAEVKLDMDFRRGGASQITQKVAASATLNERQLAGFGVDPKGMMSGPAAVSATVALQRGGHGEIVVRADLKDAVLKLDDLSFSKPAGQAATLDARVLLDGGKLSGIDRVQLEGTAIHVAGDASFSGGALDEVHIAKLTLGSDMDARGVVHLPAAPGKPIVVSLSGRSLNVSAQLAQKPPQKGEPPKAEPPKAEPAKGEPPPGPPYAVDAIFDRVVLGPGRQIGAVNLHAENNGRVFTRASLTAQSGDKAPFNLSITPHGGTRALSGSAADAGALLRAFGVVETVLGGQMILTGSYDDTRADHQLSGTAEMTEFRVRDAPILARLLQAMTLYGLLELTKGPGLGFSKLVAPFHYTGDVLELADARAFSPSLGMTAKGRIDLARQTADLQGTIVPAYFFNSLLGDVPILGPLFSPERGGGVFAATYSVRGPLDDPDVGVNPLAALTPGFLRQLFGVFDALPQPTGPAPPQRNQK